MAAVRCLVCLAADIEMLEARGAEALEAERTKAPGGLSWRRAVEGTAIRGEQLKNHMLKHVVQPEIQAATDEHDEHMRALIEEAKADLEAQFRIAPADVKPLILVAIHNLDFLRLTKPSAENLIKALKTVQEMTGMKNEQRMLLAFGQAKFGKKAEVAAPAAIAVESTQTIVREVESPPPEPASCG